MSTISPFSGLLRHALLNPTGGVAGLVDELLVLCRGHRIELDWQGGRCRVRYWEGDCEELFDVPLRKSVFRAILARLAVLCNERCPNSVTPYGGRGELLVTASPATLV
jgi:hypothetical protein